MHHYLGFQFITMRKLGYKDYCNVLPEFIKLPENIHKEWDVACFEWTEPVGTLENIEAFLEYRKSVIEGLIAQ